MEIKITPKIDTNISVKRTPKLTPAKPPGYTTYGVNMSMSHTNMSSYDVHMSQCHIPTCGNQWFQSFLGVNMPLCHIQTYFARGSSYPVSLEPVPWEPGRGTLGAQKPAPPPAPPRQQKIYYYYYYYYYYYIHATYSRYYFVSMCSSSSLSLLTCS